MEYVKKFTGGGHAESAKPAPEGHMKAVTWHGAKSIKVENVPKPQIEQGADVIVKVTACSISPGFVSQACAGDIPGMENGQILGREAIGVVEKTGPEVVKLQVGDRVAISFVIACGECSFCKRSEFSGCNRTNDSTEFSEKYGGWAPAATFGGSRLLGNIPGSHAEYVRVPFGDVNCYKIPNGVPDEKAVFVSETLVSAMHATELGEVDRGDTVVIWGLGPIGIMTAHWCKMKGAKRVIGIDHHNDRLRFAYDKLNLEVVDRAGLSSEQLTSKLQGMLPESGADVTIDACGFSGRHSWKARMGIEKESPDILKECFMVARKYGRVAVIADYTGYVDTFPIGHLMMKHLTLRAGECPVQKYFKQAFDAIEAGELDPSVLITHTVGLDGVPEMYSHCYHKDEGYLKVLVRPDQI
jgi:threonine dehydrogenase-like Zn-dependent dehydrogenase